MLVYIGLITWCVILGGVLDKKLKKENVIKPILYDLIFFALFIVSAIRYNVGTDYPGTYTNTYYDVLSGIQGIRMDFLILWIYEIMAYLDANLQWIFVITSFMITFFICKSIKEQSQIKWLSFLIYICGTFYFFSFNGIRQAIAMACFYYSFKYIHNQNKLRYAKNMVFIVLVHASEIIFAPMYFILKHRFTIKTKIIVLITLYLASSLIVPQLNTILIATKYAMYIDNSQYELMEGFNLSMIMNLLFIFLYEILRKYKQGNFSDKDEIYCNIHFFGGVVSMFATSVPLILRLFIDFRYIEYLSIPNLINGSPKRIQIFCIGLAIVYYVAYFIWNVYIENGNDVLPYQTIF